MTIREGRKVTFVTPVCYYLRFGRQVSSTHNRAIQFAEKFQFVTAIG